MGKGRPGISPDAYDNISRYLKTGKYPEEMQDESNKTRFRKTCEHYFLDTNGVLVYRSKGSEKYVLLEGEVEDVIQQIHLLLGHAQHSVVLAVLENNFFADGNIRTFVRRLSTCGVRDEDSVVHKAVSRVSVSVQRGQRLLVNLSLDGVQRTKATGDCLQVLSESGEVGMSMHRYQELCDFLQRGIVPERFYRSKYRQSAEKYIWSNQGLVTKNGRKLVLNHSDAAGVILQLHEAYGHLIGYRMPDLLKKRFECNGFKAYCEEIVLACPLCASLRKHSNSSTPHNFDSDARYDVEIKWEGEKRIISINPIGLDRKAVAEYTKMLEEKYGEKKEEGLPADKVSTANENSDLYNKVLSIGDVMLKKERSRLPDWNMNSENDAESRQSVSGRRDKKRKVSSMREMDLPSAHPMSTRKRSRGLSAAELSADAVSTGKVKAELCNSKIRLRSSERRNLLGNPVTDEHFAQPTDTVQINDGYEAENAIANVVVEMEAPQNEEQNAPDFPTEFKPEIDASKVKVEKPDDAVFVPDPADQQPRQIVQGALDEHTMQEQMDRVLYALSAERIRRRKLEAEIEKLRGSGKK